MKLPVTLIIVGALELCAAGKILYLVPVPSRSHYILSEPLVEELAKRGHEVTVVAAFRRLKPMENVIEIVVPDINESIIISGKTVPEKINEQKPKIFSLDPTETEILIEKTMTHQPVLDLLNSNQTFDLIIGNCLSMEGLLAGFAHKFKAPMVAVSTFMPFTPANEMVGNPAPSSYIPHGSSGYTDSMTFFERVMNFLQTTSSLVCFYFLHIPRQDKLMRKYFGNDVPYLKELVLNNSLVLVNHHHGLAFPRPYLPNMIEIGGYHVKPAKPLPKDIQTYMDEAEDGVIYFNMGSHLQSAEFPNEKFEKVIKIFSNLTQRVLWKFETEESSAFPENVKISKWLPQSDILAHPNLKLFITHGGLLSLTESLIRGVPIIGISKSPSQALNIQQFENLKVGLRLEFDDIGEETMSIAIREILNSSEFSNNAKSRSQILQDRPQPPIETAVYWLEYIIRYKGAPHLKSGAQKLAWYQLYSLDVLAFIGVILGLLLFSMIKLFSLMMKFIRDMRNDVKKND